MRKPDRSQVYKVLRASWPMETHTVFVDHISHEPDYQVTIVLYRRKLKSQNLVAECCRGIPWDRDHGGWDLILRTRGLRP